MKRFHVHTRVADLQASVAFYSRLFGAAPARVEADYAKWMLEDPRINFAISTRGGTPGVDHFGFQAETAEELGVLRARAAAAGTGILDEGEATCCYAHSDKHWVTDPQGIAWEHFQTLGDVPVYGNGTRKEAAACCATPAQAGVAPPAGRKAACC